MKDAVINYIDTTSPEAVDRYVKKWSRETQRAYGWKRWRRHVKRQTAAGLAMLVITLPAICLMNGDATIAVMTIPTGIGLILSAKEGLKHV